MPDYGKLFFFFSEDFSLHINICSRANLHTFSVSTREANFPLFIVGPYAYLYVHMSQPYNT